MRRNYLLFMPSLMQNNSRAIRYTATDSNLIFTGHQTNIPATEYLIDKLAANGEKLDQILLLCSDEVMHQPIVLSAEEPPVTTLAYYIRTISDWMRRYDYTEEEIQGVFFSYALNEINPGDRRSMESVQAVIQERIKGEGSKTLYLDYTGGLRSASMLLLLFARMLENEGVTVADVLYSSIYSAQDGKRCGQIESCMDTYRLFDYFDAFTEARRGSLKALEQLALADGETALADQLRSTDAAKQKGKLGKFAEISPEERSEIRISEAMSLPTRISVKLANEQRKTLSRSGSLQADMAEGNVTAASQKIREQGLRLLIEKGYVLWRSKRYQTTDQMNTAFFAYAAYYRSYLEFVHTMLLQLRSAQDGEALWQAYLAYTEEKYAISPAASSNGSIRKYMEDEFDYTYREVSDCLQQIMVEKVAVDPQNAKAVIAAVNAYTQERRRYINTYTQTGFPFANCYKTMSYSRCGSQWYDQSYKSALDEGIRRLCALPDAALQAQLQHMTQDILLLSKHFPPVQFGALFYLRDRDFAAFGEKVLLIDSIRSQRNLFTHDGENATDEDIRRTNHSILDFMSWVETL